MAVATRIEMQASLHTADDTDVIARLTDNE